MADDTDLAALRAEVERVAEVLAGERLSIELMTTADTAALLRRLLDRLARAEAERDAAREAIAEHLDLGLDLSLMKWVEELMGKHETEKACAFVARQQRDAAEARAQAAEAVCEAFGRYREQPPSRQGEPYIALLTAWRAWRAARETQA